MTMFTEKKEQVIVSPCHTLGPAYQPNSPFRWKDIVMFSRRPFIFPGRMLIIHINDSQAVASQCDCHDLIVISDTCHAWGVSCPVIREQRLQS